MRSFLLCVILLASSCVAGQLHVIKPVKKKSLISKVGIGAGYAQSVVYLTRNVNHKNDARGYNLSLLYGGNKFRLAAEYSKYKPINIMPTWESVDASTYEINTHALFYFRNKKHFFFAQLGASYNYFKGYYTGINDFLSLYSIYPRNTTVRSDWFGVNAGAGLEFRLRVCNVYMSYKMRVGRSEGREDLNIMDVCFAAGLRYYFKVPSIYALRKGTRSRYLLHTEED